MQALRRVFMFLEGRRYILQKKDFKLEMKYGAVLAIHFRKRRLFDFLPLSVQAMVFAG